MVQFSPFHPLRPPVTHVTEVSAAAFEKPAHGDYPNIPPTPGYSYLQVVNPGSYHGESLTQQDRYRLARENLTRMMQKGFVFKEPDPAFYVYRQMVGNKVYTGIIGSVSVADYEEGQVRKHELTHADKEADLANFFEEVGVNGSPVLLTHPVSHELEAFMRNLMLKPELYNFTSKDGVHHAVWRVTKASEVDFVKKSFARIPNLYIADGHHRCAATAKVAREQGTPSGFMAFCLPADHLDIFGYHRLLSHLNGYRAEELLGRLEPWFEVAPLNEKRFPERMGEIVLWANGRCWGLYPKDQMLDAPSYKAKLDVYLLEEYVIKPFLKPCNQSDPELVYTEGTLTLGRLEQQMQDNGMEVAFLLHPIAVDYLMKLSDNGETLPPKSTWIEPKMRSGMFIQQLKAT